MVKITSILLFFIFFSHYALLAHETKDSDKPIKMADVVGPEDFVIDYQNNIMFFTSKDRYRGAHLKKISPGNPRKPGKLYYVELVEGAEPKELSVPNLPRDHMFSPGGLDLNTVLLEDPKTGKLTDVTQVLYLISNGLDSVRNAHESYILRLEVKYNAKKEPILSTRADLPHVKNSQLSDPNDLTIATNGDFYATNFTGGNTLFGKWIRMSFVKKSGNIVHYDQSEDEMEKVLERLPGPNGIQLMEFTKFGYPDSTCFGPDERGEMQNRIQDGCETNILIVVTRRSNRIHTYEVMARPHYNVDEGYHHHVELVNSSDFAFVERGDNIILSADSSAILVAGTPINRKVRKHIMDTTYKCPSQVTILPLDSLHTPFPRHGLVIDLGDELGAASVAGIFNSKLYIGQIVGRGIHIIDTAIDPKAIKY